LESQSHIPNEASRLYRRALRHASLTRMSTLRNKLAKAFGSLDVNDPEKVEHLRHFYADNMHFEDPIQSIDGLDEFVSMNKRLIKRSKDLSFDVTSSNGSEDEFFLVWTMNFQPKVGPRMKVDGVSHMRAKGGKVEYQKDFWDFAELLASGIPFGPKVLKTILRPIA
jgi:hypothetical protein